MKRNIAVILILSVILSSCMTIKRWTDITDEKGDLEIDMEIKDDLFDNYLWLTPPVYSRKMIFNDVDGESAAIIEFNEKEITIIKNEDETFSIRETGKTYRPQLSKNNYYYNMDVLGTKIVPRQKLVTKTRWITQSVPVSRSYPVTRTRTVFVHGPNGQTSSRIETYTVMETRTTYETRQIPQTYTEWVTVYIKVLDIPQYEYTKIKIDDYTCLIYRVNEEGRINYYFQNITYYLGHDSSEGFLEKLVDIKDFIIDSNSNGIYFEEDDNILFNAWNPYERNSEYKEISAYINDFWYKFMTLKREKFISFSADIEAKKLMIKNANTKYIGSKNKGTINISNLPKFSEADVIINGEMYLQDFKGRLKRKIEYGLYNLKIVYKNHSDFEDTFIIDDDSTEYDLEYAAPKKGGVLTFNNDYLRHWTIIVTDEIGNERYYYDKDNINLSEGRYEIKINAMGLNIEKELNMKPGDEIKIDFQEESERLASEDNE